MKSTANLRAAILALIAERAASRRPWDDTLNSSGGHCLAGRKIKTTKSSFFCRRNNRKYARAKGDGFDTKRSMAAAAKRQRRADTLERNWTGAR